MIDPRDFFEAAVELWLWPLFWSARVVDALMASSYRAPPWQRRR